MRTTRRAILAVAAIPGLAKAQGAWPPRPVRFLVPYPPGSTIDIVARAVAQSLTGTLGQSFTVENRSGASGVIGSGEVARAAPDGTTFLVNGPTHVTLPHFSRELPFNALADFTPITNIAMAPLIVLVHSDVPVRSVQDLVSQLKANPGKYSYGSAGEATLSHLAAVSFMQITDTEMVHVPYRSSDSAMQDLMGRRIEVMFDSIQSSAGAVRDGQLRALAVTTTHRVPAFPDLPTVSEAGVPSYGVAMWYGLWAPARTPATLVAGLQEAVARAVTAPDVEMRFKALLLEPIADTPEHFAGFAKAEYDRWERVAQCIGRNCGTDPSPTPTPTPRPDGCIGRNCDRR